MHWGENMRKILFLNPYLPTLGGGEKYMGYLCQYLERYPDVKIDILVFNYNEVNVFSDSYVTIRDLNSQYGLNLVKTNIRKEDFANFSEKKKRNRILAIEKEYDLFINFMIFSRNPGLAKKNIYLCMFPPKTFTHDLNGAGLTKRLKAKVKNVIFKKSYNDFVIISKYSKNWFDRYWGKGLPTSILYSPIFEEKTIEGRYEEREKRNIILSVGRFFISGHNKKQLEMVKMFVENEGKLNEYEYHLVGAVSNYPEDISYLNEIKEIAAKSNRVYIHENCSFSELMYLYRKAKVFWHATGLNEDEEYAPEKMEHFGITTVEAMSYGAVPVVINKGGQKETVDNGKSGYLWDSEEECIAYTQKVICDNELRKRMAERSVIKAKKFSVEAFNAKCKRILEKVEWT